MKKSFFPLFILWAICGQAQTSGNRVPKLGKDPIDKVVAAMTLEEKAQLLVGATNDSFNGAGSTIGKTMDFVPGAAGTTFSIPRFGIAATVETDGPAGVRIQSTREGDSKTYYCTGFPVASLLSSTWNTGLVKQIGVAMGNEVREYGCDVLLAPALNIHRNPLCGRNFEYYSEDPLLAGKMAASIVNGVQSEGVGTSIKHFAANNQETLRTVNDAHISQRALREIYLKGFEIAVKESQPWTVMSSYNKINGVFTQEDYPLLTTLLRDEWGFKGIVMTDWTGTRNTIAQVHAGNDLMMPGNAEQIKAIISAVKEGKLSMSDVDRNVKRMLQFIVRTPRFKGYAYSDKPDLKAHAAITRQTADEGIVLLKNDNNALPLDESSKSVALFGIGSYNFLAGGTGSGDVNKAYVVNMQQGLETAGFEIQPQIKSLYEKYISFEDEQLAEVNKARGWYLGKLMPQEPIIDSTYMKFRAKDSNVAIITFGRNAGEGSDRHNTAGDFLLTQTERDLLTNVTNAFHAVNKKVIVVLNTGGVVETASWKNIPDAILLAWQPGQEGGNSVADILKGTVNPSGKLPMTFPVNYFDIPSSKNFPYDYVGYWGDEGDPKLKQTKNVGYTDYDEGIWVGYRYFNTHKKDVSYPFGYGLSYTAFSYSGSKVKRSGNNCTVSVRITNIGKISGKEIVELYASAPKGNIEKPACELKAFAKTKLLQPGESEVVTMNFAIPDLASFDEISNSWITDAGTYQIKIGSSVQDIRQTILLKINKRLVKESLAKL